MRLDHLPPPLPPPRLEARPEPPVGTAPTHAINEPTYSPSPPAPPVNGVRKAIVAERNATAYEILKWSGGILTALIVGMVVEHEFELLDQGYRITGLERVVNELGERMRAVEEHLNRMRYGEPTT